MGAGASASSPPSTRRRALGAAGVGPVPGVQGSVRRGRGAPCVGFEESAGVAPVPSPDAVRRAAAVADRLDLVAGVPRADGVRCGPSGSASTCPTTAPSSGCRPCSSAQGFHLVKSFEFTADHHARAAARLRRGRLAHREVGTPHHAGHLPRRLGRRGGRLRLRRHRARRSSPPAARCRSSTSARGARCTRSARSCTRPAVRGTGTGAAAAFGRIASIVAPLSVPILLGGGGLVLVFGVFGAAFLLAAGAALLLPESKGLALD